MNNSAFEFEIRAFEPMLSAKSSRLRYADEAIWEAIGAHPLDIQLSRLADFYGRLRAAQRRRLRGAVGYNTANNLVIYARRMSLQIMTTRDEVWLVRALAAASLENAQIDFRDSIVSLVVARAGAEAVGIYPRPHIDRAISRCDPTMIPVFANARDHRPRDVRDILREFGPPQLTPARQRRY